VGKFLITLSGSSTALFSFAVSNMGPRVATIAATYARFRILKLHLFMPQLPVSGPWYSPFAVIDDSNLGDEIPATAEGIYESRTSCLILSNGGATLEWKPVDPTKWYYTNAESSGTDDRLVIPATLVAYYNGVGTATMGVECFYTLELSGSVY
jgi:hypothetical protein